MPLAAYLLENVILVLPQHGAFAHFFKTHSGALAAFPTKNNKISEKCPGGGGGGEERACLVLTKPKISVG